MANIDTSRAWYERWAGSDWDGLAELVNDDFEVIDHARDANYRGKEGLREFVRGYIDAFGNDFDGRIELTPVGDKVVAQAVATGRHVNAYEGVAATQVEVALPAIVVQTFDPDGRLVTHEFFADQAALMAQLAGASGSRVERRHYRRGETIIREGEDPDAFYVLRSGEVDVIRGGAAVASLDAGQFFGERGLLTRERRNATVAARSDAVVDVIDATGFRDAVMADEAVAAVVRRAAAERE